MNNAVGIKKVNFRAAFLAAVASTGIFLVMLVLRRITPFGDNSWLVFDIKREYIDYFSFLKSVYQGKNNLLYTTTMSLGSGPMGLFTYYISSPILLLTLPFSRENLPVSVSLIIGIKLALCAFTANIFLDYYLRTFEEERDKYQSYCLILFSVSYSFCSYIIANSVNPMWLDAFSLLPLFLYFLDRLMFEKKYVGYVLTLSMLLYTNYYIAYMVAIFTVMWILFRLFATTLGKCMKGRVARTLLRTVCCSFLAAGIDAVILLPTFFELGNSPKDIFELGLQLTSGNLSLGTIFSKSFCFAYDARQTFWGTPLLYAGTLISFFTILYFFNKKVTVKEKIGMGIMLLIFLVSFAFDIFNIVWHAGMEPSGYPYREAFLFVFLCIICSSRCLQHFSDGITLPCVIVASALILSSLAFTATKLLDFTTDRMVIGNAVLIVVITLLLSLYLYAYEKKAGRRTLFACVLIICLVQCIDLLANSVFINKNQTASGMVKMSDYRENIRQHEGIMLRAGSRDSDFYRVENRVAREQNDAMMYNYNGITHYSSSENLYTRTILTDMGFNDDGLYSDYGKDNTVLSDCILGIRYLLNDESLDRMHTSYEGVDSSGNHILYRNPYALSAAFLVKDSPVFEKEYSESPFEYQEKIISSISGQREKVFENLEDVSITESKKDDGTPFISYEGICPRDGEVYFFINGIDKERQNLDVFVDGKERSIYGNLENLKVLNFGFRKKGEKISIEVDSYSENPTWGNIVCVVENEEAIADFYGRVQDNNLYVTQPSSSKISVKLPPDAGHKGYAGMVISLPYDLGWGKDTGFEKAYDSLLYIPAEKLENAGETLELSYYLEGFVMGVWISVISIILFAGLIVEDVVKKKKEKISDK